MSHFRSDDLRGNISNKAALVTPEKRRTKGKATLLDDPPRKGLTYIRLQAIAVDNWTGMSGKGTPVARSKKDYYQLTDSGFIDELAPGVILLNKFSGNVQINGTSTSLNGTFVINFSNSTINIDGQTFTNKDTVHHHPMPAILQTEMTIKKIEEKLSLELVKELNINNTKTLELWVSFRPEFRVEHHGFCDASQKAYGAAIYVRVEMGHTTLVHLLTAKTSVAPVKTVSLPRLELCGALLLSEMAESILPHMPMLSSKLHCWTDSTIVLAWLAKPACSRGVPLHELVDKSLWWHGPTWLQKPRDQWPAQSTDLQVTEVERRPVKAHVASIPTEDILDRFSKLNRALRVFAYVHRFVQRCRKQSPIPEVHLEAQELVAAERLMVISTQRRYFANEYRCLSQKRPVSATSSILSLNPFLDEKGLIRACGRITASENLRYDERHA
ncbi:uncharacterized protein LOC123037185 [Drosophila rhopaloa]|uniref:Uncharacterized protein n=1 Tax=Drosophila rhopaloa TaxID=1041015 RepID=A0ABM5J1N2_DRORH|nr:uncharacterized protein LOC123037185 [Drosophila rhopaloa]